MLDADDTDDLQTCLIRKENQFKKKRNSLGGIVAAVSSCQLFVGWRPYSGGEGRSDVYILLANIFAIITTAASRQPLAVFYDNACALQAFACNPRRQALSNASRALATMKYLLDIWHRDNHTACLADETLRAELDPRHESNAHLRVYNTEVCEQAFAWLDRLIYGFLEMGPGLFAAQITFLMDRRNRRIVKERVAKE